MATPTVTVGASSTIDASAPTVDSHRDHDLNLDATQLLREAAGVAARAAAEVPRNADRDAPGWEPRPHQTGENQNEAATGGGKKKSAGMLFGCCVGRNS